MNDLIAESVFIPVEAFIKTMQGYSFVDSLHFLCPLCGNVLYTKFYPDLQEVEIEKCRKHKGEVK